jgi:hypothetical protein
MSLSLTHRKTISGSGQNDYCKIPKMPLETKKTVCKKVKNKHRYHTGKTV